MLFPTLKATVLEEALAKNSVPGPVSPPNVAAVSDPKSNAPLPLVSSVLFCRAKAFPNESVPPLTRVLPLKVLGVARISVPLSTLGQAGPGKGTGERTVYPAVSKVCSAAAGAQRHGQACGKRNKLIGLEPYRR